MPWDYPIRRTVLAYKNNRLRRFVSGTAHARATQERVLLEKVARSAASDFGKQFGFSIIRSIEDYRRQVPITNYEDYRPFIDRVMRGDVAALFNPGTRILMFAMTSGTTAKPKYIPVTEQFYKEYRESWNLWGTGVYQDHRDVLNKVTMTLTSDWRQEYAPSGVPCGNISGLAAETRPAYTRNLFLLPPAIVRVREAAAKHYTALRIGLATNQVGMIITANPSTLVEFAKRANAWKESLIRDIHNGTLSEQQDVPGPVRKQLRPWLKRNRKRARLLDALAERSEPFYPKEFWPNLSVLAVWTGGSVGVYLSQLPEYYGTFTLRDHGISASEGRVTIPIENGIRPGILDYPHLYFEFIPEREYGTAHPTVLGGHELAPDENYYVLLTNAGGLYRYDICDVVRCMGFVGEAPLLVFLNKGKHFSSITGEKLSEHQVISAVTKSFEVLELPNVIFTLAPVMESLPVYELLLESGPHTNHPSLAQVAQRYLCEQNGEYAEKCASGRLQPLRVREVPPNKWTEYRLARTQVRGNFEEFKHPCLVGDLDFAKRVLE